MLKLSSLSEKPIPPPTPALKFSVTVLLASRTEARKLKMPPPWLYTLFEVLFLLTVLLISEIITEARKKSSA